MNLDIIRVMKRFDDDTNVENLHNKFKSVKRSSLNGFPQLREAKSKKNPSIVANQINLNSEAIKSLYVSLLMIWRAT